MDMNQSTSVGQPVLDARLTGSYLTQSVMHGMILGRSVQLVSLTFSNLGRISIMTTLVINQPKSPLALIC